MLWTMPVLASNILSLPKDVRLHSEVPLVPLPGLMHLRVALPSPVLGGGRCLDDGGVHDGSFPQLQSLGLKPWDSRWALLSSKRPCPSLGLSRRWRKLRMVVSSGRGPGSFNPTNRRTGSDSLRLRSGRAPSRSSMPGSLRACPRPRPGGGKSWLVHLPSLPQQAPAGSSLLCHIPPDLFREFLSGCVSCVLQGTIGKVDLPVCSEPHHPSDAAALAALYAAANGEQRERNDNWLSDEPLGEWPGISTDRAGRVVRVPLGENNLAGEIPIEPAQMSELVRLARIATPLAEEFPQSWVVFKTWGGWIFQITASRGKFHLNLETSPG